MPRRGENIRKRSDGRWEGRVKTVDEFSGQSKYHSIYAHSYSEIKSKLEKEKLMNNVDQQEAKPLTINDALKVWLEANEFRLKKSTMHKYEFLIKKHIAPEIGGQVINERLQPLLNEFVFDKLTCGKANNEKGLSPTYVKTIINIVQSAIQYAIEVNLCVPIRGVNKKYINLGTERKEFSILDRQEQQEFESKLLIDMDTTKLGIFISLNTGLRIGEICSLTWNDVDLDNGIIYVHSTISRIKANPSSNRKTELIIDSPKTKNSTRMIPISSKLYPVLQSMKQASKYDYVVSNNDSFTSPRTYEYRFHKALNDCNIRSINYHTLRHTFATRCVEVGIDVKTLSEILGHANVGITMNTYVHPSMKMKREQLEKLSSY